MRCQTRSTNAKDEDAAGTKMRAQNTYLKTSEIASCYIFLSAYESPSCVCINICMYTYTKMRPKRAKMRPKRTKRRPTMAKPGR